MPSLLKEFQAAGEDWPVFEMDLAAQQQLGLLKLAEMAARQGGDQVRLRLGKDSEFFLFCGASGLKALAWSARHQPAERGDVTSDRAATRIVLGDSELSRRWQSQGLPVDALMVPWLERACADATRALLRDMEGIDSHDLRSLSRMWSVRACCPAVFGQSLADVDLADGLLRIEEFYAAMAAGPQAEAASIQEALARADAFIDGAICAALAGRQLPDRSVVSTLCQNPPTSAGPNGFVQELRPVVLGLLFEVIQVDGLNLLWALLELARDAELVDAIAEEARISLRAGPLARSVAMETLRLYPELPFIRRRAPAAADGDAGGIPEGACMLFSPWLIQRDGRLWPEPSRFQPRRFMTATSLLDPLPAGYVPCGVGPLAQRRTEFVIGQVAATISTVCAAGRFHLAPGCRPGDLRPSLRSTLQPRGAVEILWRPRIEVHRRLGC